MRKLIRITFLVPLFTVGLPLIYSIAWLLSGTEVAKQLIKELFFVAIHGDDAL